MKALKISLIIIAVAVFVSGILYLFFKPLFYHFLYPFDRITGTIHVTMNGEKYNLKSDDVTGQYESNDEINVKARKETDGLNISVHGGEYGPYSLVIHIDGLNEPIQARIYQYNWWNVTSFNLDITIDSAEESIKFTSSANVNGVTENNSTTVAFSDDPFVYYIVSI